MDYKKNIEGADEMDTDELFERLKKSGEIKVSTIGGSDYVLKEDMIDRLQGK